MEHLWRMHLWRMHITSAALIFYCSLFSAALSVAEPFTVRYLNRNNGNDTTDCLSASPTQACKTLRYALSGNISHLNLLIWPEKYNYGTENELRISNARNLLIEKMANASDERVIFNCSSYNDNVYNNLAFFNAKNITISGITFEECGPKSAAMFMKNCTGLQISNCTFRNNPGGGLFLLNVLNAHVVNCTFVNNFGNRPSVNNDPAVVDREYGFGGLSILFSGTAHATTTVTNCNFTNNTASVNERNSNDSRPQGYTPFGHGGAMVILLTDSAHSTQVDVTNCTFEQNSAHSTGGSISIPIFQHSRNNSVIISNSTFNESTANGSGGALSIDVFDVGENNTVEVVDTTFFNGKAWFGGGAISIVLQDSLALLTRTDTSNPTVAHLKRCRFEGNYSPTGGSAVGLVSNARVDQLNLAVTMTDCIFKENRASNRSALFTFRLPLVFMGTNIFCSNEGGAIYLLQTSLNTYGTLVFENNTATRGGAVTFEDFSVMNLHNGTNVIFERNRADTVGGAILVDNPTLIQDTNPLFNSLCFFQYETEMENAKSLSPKEWENVSVTFTSNTAGHAGAAIYAADIRVCTFTSVECVPRAVTSNLTWFQRSIFLQDPPFNFSDNQVFGKQPLQDGFVAEVATAPSILHVAPEPPMAAPSERLNISIRAHDQSGNQREAIWAFDDDAVPTTVLRGFSVGDTPKLHPFTLVVPNISQESCKNQVTGDTPTGHQEMLEFFIIQTLIGEVSYETHVSIDVTCCHPGYTYNSTTRTCVFDSSFPHLLRPDQDNRYVYLEPGYYAGFYNDISLNETYFTTALFSSVFQDCSREGARTGCLYKYDKPDEQCAGNRTGYLCGQCPTGMGVDFTLRICKECTEWDAVGLIVICLLVVVISALILVFNIGVPNDLLGFLFFAQVVGFVYQSGESGRWDYHLSRLLGFSVYLPICPFTALPALWTTAFGFLPSILAITTVVIYIICARFIRPLSQRTAFSGIWLIFLFVYKYTADTTFNLLKCVQLEGNEVDQRYPLKLVFYYDGTVQCFTGDHLIVAIPSLLLFVLVVFILPASIIVISFKRFKTTQAFTDVITDGVTKRWWSGFDVIRRLMYIVMVTVTDFAGPNYTQLILVFTTMVVLGVLCAAKPYKRPITNFIEALILFDLLLISIHFLNEQEFRGVATPFFSLILLLLPFIYAIGNISIRVGVMIWKKYSPYDATTALRKFRKMPRRISKPLLKQPSTDMQEFSASSAQDVEPQVAGRGGEHDHFEADYSHFREPLFETLQD